MMLPAYPTGGGFMPSPSNLLPQRQVLQQVGSWPTIEQAYNALTPNLYRAACECRGVRGSGFAAVLANLFGNVSFAAAGNFRISDGKGRSMPLTLHIRFAGQRLSGKSAAHVRLHAPVKEAMKGWLKRWKIGNITKAAVLRGIRNGAALSILTSAEGRGHLSPRDGEFSRAYEDLSELHDGHVPSFDRADDDEEQVLANTPDSVVFVTCVNVQDDAHRTWLDEYGTSAIDSGYLFRLLMIETDELACEGVGGWQPEVALVEYDRRIVELVNSSRLNAETVSLKHLSVIEVSHDAEQVLRQAHVRIAAMAGTILSARDTLVFPVRFVAHARRIAGCMHAFEGYEGAVSADTMMRAATITEYFAASWLSTVHPPKPVPDSVLRGQRLLDYLVGRMNTSGKRESSWRKADIEVLAPNFGWPKAQMIEAITAICAHGFARVEPRIEKGRRVIMLELTIQAGAPDPDSMVRRSA